MDGTIRDDGPLLGREPEMALLASLIDDVGSAGGSLVLRGEPGIGKSRLLAEATALARACGMTVLSTSGVQAEAQLPFAGLHQLLRPVRGRAAQLTTEQQSALDAAFGYAVEEEPGHFRIAMAVLDLLCDVSTTAHLLVVVEDAHWLDHATAEVLAFVARRLEADPIVLLVSTRDGYDSPLTEAGLPERSLGPLDAAAAAAVLDAVAPHLTITNRDAVLDHAAGNPLALKELPQTAGRADAGVPGLLPLTERLERAFAARLSELPDSTRLLLLVAALNDRDSTHEVEQAASLVLGQPSDLAALESAARAALIDLDVGSVRFRHPLVRAALRQSASVQDQRAVHQALGEVLNDDPDRRVWHRAALIHGVHEDVARELEDAAARARRRGAIGVAVAALRRAVELSERGTAAPRIFAAAQLAFEQGRNDVVRDLLRGTEHLELGSLDRARAAWIAELVDMRPLVDHTRVPDLIAAAESAGADGDRRLHADMLWLLTTRTWYTGAGPEVRRLILDAAERLGPPDAADPQLVAIHAYADPLGNAPAVLRCLNAAAEGRVTDLESARYLGAAATNTSAFDHGAAFARIAVDRARAEGRLGALPRLLALQAIVAVRTTDWNGGLSSADEASRLAAELSQPLWGAAALTAVSAIAALRGDEEGAERAAARAEEIALPISARFVTAMAQGGRILAPLGAGHYEQAYRAAERVFDPSDPAHHRVFAAMFVGDLAEAALHSGHAEAARARVGEVEAAVGAEPSVWIGINLRHARVLLAHDDTEAAKYFDDAFAADLGRWPFWRARLLLAHGRWLRRQRQIAESRTPLREARDAFEALGCTAWSDQARRELRASGETSRRRGAADPQAGLTAQELQIAQLAAEGLSNKEIAQRLYLSHRTISTHLYRIYPKLGITGRHDLLAALSGQPD